jgi:hypothetical protein
MVFSDRATQRAAELILVEHRPGLLIQVAAIQKRVPIELKGRSMEIIRAGFDDGVKNGSRVAAVFRIDRARNQVELRNGVRAGDDGGFI